MITKHLLLPLALLLIGGGCVPVTTPEPVEQAPVAVADPYEGWHEIQPGGVVSMRIPPNCQADPGAGNLYVVCPENEGDTPTPDMHISSDGIQVNIRRWENMEWDQWDKVIASLRVMPDLDRDVQISIQK